MRTAGIVAAGTSPPPTEPITEAERIELLDVVRGFALYGVLLANLVWVSQEAAVTEAQVAALPTAPIDRVVRYAIQFFVDGKFYTLFAFLFGLGFAVQLMRGEARGAAIVPVYLRRLGVLLLIGLAHAYFLWYGDILHHYALFGFLLLVFRRCSNRTLMVLGFSLGVALAATMAGAKLLWTAAPIGAIALDPPERQVIDARFRAFMGSSYVAAWQENAKFAASYWTAGLVLPALPAIAGRFLLGYYSGRRRLLHEPEAHLQLFRRLLGWGLALGLVGNAIWVMTTVLTRAGTLAPASPWVIAAQFPIHVGYVAMAGCYLAAIVLLSQRPAWRRRLAHLAPVGRTALTNYLAQSLVYVFVFYGLGAGLGLLGRLGTTFCLGLSVVVFAAQIVLSGWWLQRFRFGPAEWAWRALTYGVLPPMRRATTTPGGA